jgi:hypothetical protein
VRIPKSYLLLNGILLLCAIVSWTWFLKKQSEEQQRNSAAAVAFRSSFLGLRLPKGSKIELAIDGPGGTSIDPFPSAIGKVLGPAEVEQLDAYANFFTALCEADEIAESTNWIRLGEARVSGEEGTAVVQVFRTADKQLGFEYEGSHYRTGFNARSILELIGTAQKP